MILLWVTLALLHQGHTLAPVTTVRLGEPATFTCGLPNEGLSRRDIYWYKQSAGDTLKSIITFYKSTEPHYATEFSESRFVVNHDNSFYNLTILRTFQEDEGMYHCALVEGWTGNTWSGTYLSIKGNTQRSSTYTVIQSPSPSDPVRPGDSVSLQCSVLSDSENKTCPGDHRVYWFRAGSDESHPDIIYTDGNTHDECDKRSDTQKSCVYHLSKNVSSTDAGIYYCAVATCGEILFGNGTKLQIECRLSSEWIALVIAVVFLVISMIGNIVFICYLRAGAVRAKCRGVERASSEARHHDSNQDTTTVHDISDGGEDLNYAALHFSGGKATRGRRKKELKTEESLYSQVKLSM